MHRNKRRNFGKKPGASRVRCYIEDVNTAATAARNVAITHATVSLVAELWDESHLGYILVDSNDEECGAAQPKADGTWTVHLNGIGISDTAGANLEEALEAACVAVYFGVFAFDAVA